MLGVLDNGERAPGATVARRLKTVADTCPFEHERLSAI